MVLPIASIINALAIVVGGSVGLFLNKRFPTKIQIALFQALGLSTLLIGLQMALKVEDMLALVFSMAIGATIGTVLNLEEKLNQLGDFFKRKIKSKNKTFTEGFVTASLLFCVGAMAVIGSINEGLSGDRSVLYTKSVLDGATSVAFASTFGVGVLFSAIPVLLYQGSITLLASSAESFFSELVISQLTAVGGLLIVGIGINLLEIKKIPVVNLLPAILVAILFALAS